jgi:hypothetical protein
MSDLKNKRIITIATTGVRPTKDEEFIIREEQEFKDYE